MANDDKELKAMVGCAKLLGDLTEAERGRALSWLNEKFGAEEPVAYRPVDIAGGGVFVAAADSKLDATWRPK